jgi:hypothetical protein
MVDVGNIIKVVDTGIGPERPDGFVFETGGNIFAIRTELDLRTFQMQPA